MDWFHVHWNKINAAAFLQGYNAARIYFILLQISQRAAKL